MSILQYSFYCFLFHAQLPHVHTIPTLRLLTWNVRGGLRKKLSDPNFGCVLKQADVSVLTETRHISFKPHVPGYICYMSAPIGNKAGKRGAGGVCVFIADRIAHAVKSTVEHDESMLCIVLNGSYFGYSDDIYVFGVYMAHRGSTLYESTRLDKLKSILRDVPQQAHVVLLGDMNARCGSLTPSFKVHNSMSFASFSVGNGGTVHADPTDDMLFLRNTEDTTVNANGRALVDLCSSCSLHILNGLHTIGNTVLDKQRLYDGDTYCDYNRNCASSVIDYVCVDSALLCNISSLVSMERYELSDHFPILCTIGPPSQGDHHVEERQPFPYDFNWGKRGQCMNVHDVNEMLANSDDFKSLGDQACKLLFDHDVTCLGVQANEPVDLQSVLELFVLYIRVPVRPIRRVLRVKQPMEEGVNAGVAIVELNSVRGLIVNAKRVSNI